MDPEHRPTHIYCIGCDYILDHLPSGACPECGRPFYLGKRSTFTTTPKLRRWRRRLAIFLLIPLLPLVAFALLGLMMSVLEPVVRYTSTFPPIHMLILIFLIGGCVATAVRRKPRDLGVALVGLVMQVPLILVWQFHKTARFAFMDSRAAWSGSVLDPSQEQRVRWVFFAGEFLLLLVLLLAALRARETSVPRAANIRRGFAIGGMIMQAWIAATIVQMNPVESDIPVPRFTSAAALSPDGATEIQVVSYFQYRTLPGGIVLSRQKGDWLWRPVEQVFSPQMGDGQGCGIVWSDDPAKVECRFHGTTDPVIIGLKPHADAK